MESTANIKSLKEIIIDVDEEGEARYYHEVTLTFHTLTRFEYLQLHRQQKAGNVIMTAIGLISPEMALEVRERERLRTADNDQMDEQVREALNVKPEDRPDDFPGLAEAAGFKKEQPVTIISTGVHGIITKIVMGGTGPMFWVPTDEHANREYAADEIEPYTAEKKRRSRRSKATTGGQEEDPEPEGEGGKPEDVEVNLGAEIGSPSVQVDATVTTPDPEDYSTEEESESGQEENPADE